MTVFALCLKGFGVHSVAIELPKLLDRVGIDRELVRRGGLAAFGRLAWHIVEPAVPYVHNWHVDLQCDHLLACLAGVAPELVINVPPGTGKSLWCSVFLPAWVWTIWPGFTMGFSSYDIGISTRDADRTLKIIESDWYKERWPGVKLNSRTPAKTDFGNTAGGFRFATSVESAVTGRHFDLRLVDDPIKPLDTVGTASATQSQLEKVRQWWDGSMTTRVKDPKNARYAIIMQRLHQDDLAGYLLEKDKPVHLRLPMRFEKADACNNPGIGRDPRTIEGELLWPGRYPEKAVAKLEKALHIYAPAQLQQNPITGDGEIFKIDWLAKRWTPDTLPRLTNPILSVDCTFKSTSGSDFVSMQVWGSDGVNYYLLDERNERLSFVDTVEAIRRMIQKWPTLSAKLIEDKANGSAVIEILQKTISGIIPVNPLGGKVARANAISHLHQAGNVWYPTPDHSPWIVQHIAQLLAFPKGRNDDSVDSESQALAYLSQHAANVFAAMNSLIARGG
jgi:predicted phage terminase large subunit-like protein